MANKTVLVYGPRDDRVLFSTSLIKATRIINQGRGAWLFEGRILRLNAINPATDMREPESERYIRVRRALVPRMMTRNEQIAISSKVRSG